MNQLTTQKNYRSKLIACIVALVTMLTILMIATPSAFAEGTSDLVANGGYRPYTERYNSSTLGQQRMSVMHVYLNAGETAYFGTSVDNATLYNTSNGVNSDWLFSNGAMGTSYSDAQLAYVNTADVYVAQGNYGNIADAIGAGMTPGKPGVTLVDLAADATNTTPGYIYDSTQEKGKVDLSGSGAGYKVTDKNSISSSTAGYVAGVKTNANTFTAPSAGIYTVVFFSSKHSGENPVKVKADNTTPFAKTQKGGTIASWDISVYNGSTLQTGRVFTSTLFINMGGNVLSNGVSTGSLYADVYAVTDDGYRYKVDFNGMDPFGFVFFANNRGLLNTAEGGSSSLYHGVRSNSATLADVSSHGIALNNTPYDKNLDKTYNLFYEQPSTEALGALGIPTDPTAGNGTIDNFAFTGTGDSNANEGYVGKGGTFSFDASSNISATSYEIDLDFTGIGGGTVVLGNTLVKGASNSIAWNGKDANGKIVPAGKYGTIKASIKLKGGEVHFPLLDVEQNPFGIKITRLNGTNPNSTIYFNNSASNAGDTTAPWTLDYNWKVGSQVDATTGVDSSNGAMAFTNDKTAINYKGKLLGDGDMCALDVWAHYDRSVSLGNWKFSLVDTSFTVTKVWNRGTQAVANPTKVTMTLYAKDGTKVSTDATGAPITNPVTYDTATAAAYTWQHLDPTKTYYVTETPITGYSTIYGNVDGYAQTVTNTYQPTTLKLTKVWNMNGSTETHPASVTLSVYTAKDMGGTHIGDYTLDATNNWTTTIDPVDSTLTYYVYETAVDGMTITDFKLAYTITGEGKASGNGNDGFQSTITNTFNSSDFMSVEVFKLWTDGDTYAAYQPTSIKVGLYKDNVLVTRDATGAAITNPVTLNDANSWYYIWPALVAKDTSDKGYTIKETDSDGNTLSGYTATTDSMKFLHNFGYGGFENAYQTTSFTVSKDWAHGTQTQVDQPTSVTVQLQQSTDGGKTYADYDDAQTLTVADADSAGNWVHTWKGLPTYTSKGTAIEYQAVEIPVSGYNLTAGTVTGDITNGYKQTLTNTYAYTDITVNKTWDYGMQAEADRPQSVNVALKDTQGTVSTAALNADNNWSFTFANLPIPGNGESTDNVYTVVEEPVDGYTDNGGAALSGSDAGGWTVDLQNTYDYTAFTATKIWDHGIQDQADWPTSVALQLQKSTDGGTTYANEGSPVTLTSANADSAGNWTYTWSTLARDATYQVVETTPDGYSATASEVTGSATTGWAQSITNTFTNVTSLSVNKVWEHGTQDSADYPTYIEVQLYADGQQYGKAVTITADDGWIHTWPALDASKTYTLKETTVAGYTTSGGTVSGTKATGLTATFTNTYNEPVVPVEPGSVVPDAVTPSSVTPDTGDAFGMLVSALVGVLVLGAGAVLIARSKRRRS